MIRRASIDDIITATCSGLGVQRGDLLGSGRHERVVLARSIIAHLAKRMTLMSYPEIAMFMGRTSHSTFWTADKRLEALLARERRLSPHERLLTRLVNIIAERAARRREAAA